MKLETNVLYYGDNLDVLRKHIPDESIDLIYLDPPFNSNRSYNVLFKESSGAGSEAQIEAFEDSWHWGPPARDAFEAVRSGANQNVARMLEAMVLGLGHNDVTAYLTMMAIRLVELHRALKATGSIYLHCDPTAGPYLRVLMDAIFRPANLVNEIVWKRSSAHSDRAQGSAHFGRVHDTLLVYGKSADHVWNQQYEDHSAEYIASHYGNTESQTGRKYRLDNLTGPGGAAKGNPSYEVMGVTRYWRYSQKRMHELIRAGRVVQTKPGAVPQYKRYLDEMEGTPLQDVWVDLPPINSQAKERLGYPTQKPLSLLERVIAVSSNENDVVLDPFCGCGTAVHAAHRLKRQWIGMDVTPLATGLIRRRMQDAFPGIEITVHGEPRDMAGARELAVTNPRHFEYWAVLKVDGAPTGGKGPDLDGVLPFTEFGGRPKRAVVSVKGTKAASPVMLRELKGAMDDDKPIGVLITLAQPTPGMKTQEAAAGFYESGGRKYPRVQILTVADIFKGKRPQLPPKLSPFAEAPVERERAEKPRLL